MFQEVRHIINQLNSQNRHASEDVLNEILDELQHRYPNEELIVNPIDLHHMFMTITNTHTLQIRLAEDLTDTFTQIGIYA